MTLIRWISALSVSALLGLGTSISLAQTAAEKHNAPGGPRPKAESLVIQQGFTLPPPPPAPPASSTSTVTSTPAAPPKKK